MYNNGRQCIKNDNDNGNGLGWWDHAYFLLSSSDSQYCLALEHKIVGSRRNPLVVEIPSAISKLTHSQEMTEDVFNETYCKHSILELLF